jgi:hypothetical protein
MTLFNDESEVATSRDPVGAAIKAGEVARIQRNTMQENQMFGGSRTIAPINPDSSDPIGAANKQNQAAFIQRNTAQENRMFGGVSAPKASPEELIDNAIDAKRADIASRQSDLQSQIPSTSGKYRTKLIEEHTMLQHQEALLQRESHERAQMKLRVAEDNFKVQRETQKAEQITGFYSAMSGLKTSIGTPEHVQEMLPIAAQFPLAMSDPSVRKTLAEHAAVHDSAADLRQKAADQLGMTLEEFNKSGFQVKSVTSGGTKGQERITFTKPSSEVEKVATSDLAKLGITPEEFQQHSNPRATTSEKAGNAKDIEAKRSADGQMIAFDVAGRETPILVGRTMYERLAKVFPKIEATPKTSGNPRSDGGSVPDEGDIKTNPNITPEAHAALKPGEKFWWNGKQLTKQ